MSDISSVGITLGQHQDYTEQYDPSLLQSIDRAPARANLVVVPPNGADIWTSYELSWLDSTGKPHVAIAEFTISGSSSYIVESKSFKYYLNSFNQTVFAGRDIVTETLVRDVGRAVGGAVQVQVYSLDEYAQRRAQVEPLGVCLDYLSLTVERYRPAPELLQLGQDYSRAIWLSHLLKSNCPVTGQPDWASVWIGYEGQTIVPQSLLAYIVSFRQHQDFHEHCVERIFSDLWQFAKPEKLWVYARYTRRGGLDINPYRSSEVCPVPPVIAARQ